MGLWDRIVDLAGGEFDLLSKAARTVEATSAPTPGSKPRRQDAASDLARAVGLAPGGAAAAPGAAWTLDPWDTQNLVSPEVSHTRGTDGLSPEALRYLARMPVIDALLGVMVGDIAGFHVPQPHRFAPGYTFAMRDPKAKTSKAAKKRIQELVEWTSTCGDPTLNPGMTFEMWARKSFRDSFILDWLTTEVRHTKAGKICGFEHVDSATIWRAQPSREEIVAGRRDVQTETAYVQVINNKRTAEFSTGQLITGVRRPRGDLRVNGYGYPELEVLIRYVTYLLNAELFNAANFTNGVHTAGVGVFKTKMSDDTFRAFERKWYALLDGASKAKKVPMVKLDTDDKEDFKFVSMGATNKEMEFVQWINHIFQGVCFVYGVDPAELGKVYGNEGQSSSMQSGGPNDRIQASKRRWRDPVLRAEAEWLNRGIFYKIDEDFCLQFVGMDPETEAARLDSMSKAGKTHKTVNELRALDDLEPLGLPEAGTSPADWGPMDTTYIAAVQQAMAARDQPEGGGEMPGAGAAPGGYGAEDEGDADEPSSDLPTEFDVDDIFGKPGKPGAGGKDEDEPAPRRGKPNPAADDDDAPDGDAPNPAPATKNLGKLKKGFAILREVVVEV